MPCLMICMHQYIKGGVWFENWMVIVMRMGIGMIIVIGMYLKENDEK